MTIALYLIFSHRPTMFYEVNSINQTNQASNSRTTIVDYIFQYDENRNL